MRHVSVERDAPTDYWIDDVRNRPGALDIRITNRAGVAARIELNLPSSGLSQPWLYTSPTDAADWLRQLMIWIDEEVFTGGLGDRFQRVDSDGESYVAVELYGFRVKDPARHAELLDASAGGWYGPPGALRG